MTMQHEPAPAAPLPGVNGQQLPPYARGVRIISLAVAMALFVLAFYCRLRLLAVPLERDEGGFAYIAQQMLNGIPPFDSGYSMKLMGIHAVYAVTMAVLGQTPTAIHAGLLVANLVSCLLLYFLARRFLPLEWAAIAVGVYGLLAVSKDVMGVFAHATHFVMVFVLAGLLTYMLWRENGKPLLLLASGLCMGAAITMKQNGIFCSLFVFALLVHEISCRKQPWWAATGTIALWIMGLIVPYGCILIYVASAGVLPSFWFWTVTYSFEYVTDPLSAEFLWSLLQGVREVTSSTLPLWVLALVGMVFLLGKRTVIPDRWFPLLFLAISVVSIIPGGYFYPHYFVLLLPALSLLIGSALCSMAHLASRFVNGITAPLVPLCSIVVVCALVVNTGKQYLFSFTPRQVSWLVYGQNPFAESSQAIASYIQANSSPGDTMAILGSEPQIYFYAQRQSATRQIFMYSMTDATPYAQPLQKELLTELEANNPKFIVVSMQPTSWNVPPESLMQYLQPFMPFVVSRYSLVGVVDILTEVSVKYQWLAAGEPAESYTNFPLYVLRRKS